MRGLSFEETSQRGAGASSNIILIGVWFQRLKTCKNAEKLGKGIAYIEVCRVICKSRKEKTSF